MPGTLFVVATPIGNLEDITLRALRVLREVALVAAEDTRRSGNLLRHFGIETSLLSLHEHNEYERIPELIARLKRGDSLAVISDAGTPGIADPGGRLVAAARAEGVAVQPVPGPSSVIAALSVSGWGDRRFAFGGYVPIRSNERIHWAQWVESLHDIPVVFFEAPHRISKTLKDFRAYFGMRPILLGREVTKLYESWDFGTAEDLLATVKQPMGEYVGVLGPQPGVATEPLAVSDAEIELVFGQTADDGPASRRDAVKRTAQQLGLSVNAVYAALERAKSSGE